MNDLQKSALADAIRSVKTQQTAPAPMKALSAEKLCCPECGYEGDEADFRYKAGKKPMAMPSAEGEPEGEA